MKKSLKIVMDPFCFKQFDPSSGSAFINYDKDEFNTKVNDFYLAVKDQGGLKDGYAPFCKHLFIENFSEAVNLHLEITPENKKLIECAYESRRVEELAVLARWFDKIALEENGI